MLQHEVWLNTVHKFEIILQIYESILYVYTVLECVQFRLICLQMSFIILVCLFSASWILWCFYKACEPNYLKKPMKTTNLSISKIWCLSLLIGLFCFWQWFIANQQAGLRISFYWRKQFLKCKKNYRLIK